MEKYLDILKASGWQTILMAAALWLLLLAHQQAWLPIALDAWWLAAILVGASICTALGIAAVGPYLTKAAKVPLVARQRRLSRERAKEEVRSYLKFANEDERRIIGFLLANNIKSFTTATDGGNAATMFGRHLLIRSVQPGQVFSMNDMPVTVPDHVWEVFEEMRAEFPNTVKKGDADPWRQRWI